MNITSVAKDIHQTVIRQDPRLQNVIYRGIQPFKSLVLLILSEEVYKNWFTKETASKFPLLGSVDTIHSYLGAFDHFMGIYTCSSSSNMAKKHLQTLFYIYNIVYKKICINICRADFRMYL